MSREINLPRVWDTVLKEMLYPKWRTDYIGGVKTSLYVYTSKKESPNHSSLSWVLHQPEFVVMWPTGLKDNETDIFEGDIVQGAVQKGVIVWRNTAAAFLIDVENKHIVFASAWAGMKVIGNIHQSPDSWRSNHG